MKLALHILIDELEVETSDSHGNIDHVWLDGKDWVESTVHDLVLHAAGGTSGWQDRIMQAAAAAIEDREARRGQV